jgi:hypothetical protein
VTGGRVLRLILVGLLGAGAAALVSCGSSGVGLIPAEDAGPLVADFQAVERAAATGDGDCAPTKAALQTTERDFQELPRGVDGGLRGRLREGIHHLQVLALELCAQPTAQTTTGESTSTASHATTTPPPSSTSTGKTPPTNTTGGESTPTTGTSPAPSGTTPAPGAEGGTAPEAGGSGVEGGEGQRSGEAHEGREGLGEEAGAGGSGVSGGTGSSGRGAGQ